MRHLRAGVGLGLALTIAAAATLHAEDAPFKIVVPASMPGTAIKRSIVADIFLKKITRWGDGSSMNPVDQSATSPVRISFSQQVIGKPVDGVQIHWMRQMSSPRGTSPPPVKASDEEVIAFVASKPGAIGYVSEAATLPEGVKAIQLTE